MSAVRDPRIDAYIEKSAPFAQPILKHLSECVHAACPDATETIKWGMPYFQYRGAMLGGMAAFKAHCSFGFWHHGMAAILREAGIRGDGAAGSFGPITALRDLPPRKQLMRYIKEAAKLAESGEPARARTVAAKPLRVPPDLAAALKKNTEAAKTFEAFSPSHRKEYIAWITEAKREETRARRLATAIEWLAEGKSRNWKYSGC